MGNHGAISGITSSQLTKAVVQVVWRAAIQRASGLRRTADVWPDSGSASGIGGSGHRLAKAQCRRSA